MDATSSNGEQCGGHDPLEALIADGRVGARPTIPYKDATILIINFALLENKIRSLLSGAYVDHEPLRNAYSGAPDLISKMIANDIACLTRYAILALYHRLRTIAEFYCPFAVSTRMLDDVAHYINPRMEFPTFLSSLLSSIGALRISYCAPKDVLIVYAPSVTGKYIKSIINIPGTHERSYHRLITNLRLCGVGLSSLDYDHLEGAFWTTCFLTNIKSTDLLNVLGTVNPTYYVNEDVVRSLALLDSKGHSPFEGIMGLIIGYTDNADVVASVEADVPPTTPEGFPADKALNRLVGWTYNVNNFGIQPASLGNPPGVYIIGRGSTASYTCILGQHLSPAEVSDVLRYRLLAPLELTKSE